MQDATWSITKHNFAGGPDSAVGVSQQRGRQRGRSVVAGLAGSTVTGTTWCTMLSGVATCCSVFQRATTTKARLSQPPTQRVCQCGIRCGVCSACCASPVRRAVLPLRCNTPHCLCNAHYTRCMVSQARQVPMHRCGAGGRMRPSAAAPTHPTRRALAGARRAHAAPHTALRRKCCGVKSHRARAPSRACNRPCALAHAQVRAG